MEQILTQVKFNRSFVISSQHSWEWKEKKMRIMEDNLTTLKGYRKFMRLSNTFWMLIVITSSSSIMHFTDNWRTTLQISFPYLIWSSLVSTRSHSWHSKIKMQQEVSNLNWTKLEWEIRMADPLFKWDHSTCELIIASVILILLILTSWSQLRVLWFVTVISFLRWKRQHSNVSNAIFKRVNLSREDVSLSQIIVKIATADIPSKWCTTLVTSLISSMWNFKRPQNLSLKARPLTQYISVFMKIWSISSSQEIGSRLSEYIKLWVWESTLTKEFWGMFTGHTLMWLILSDLINADSMSISSNSRMGEINQWLIWKMRMLFKINFWRMIMNDYSMNVRSKDSRISQMIPNFTTN